MPPEAVFDPPSRLTYSVDELPAVTGLGKTRLYELMNSGAITARKAGRRTLILREDVEAFLRGLPTVGSL